MKVEFTAWVINSKSDEGPGFLGKYWWFKGQPPLISEHLEGCQVALFKTRAIARENLKGVRGEPGDGKYHSFPNAVVEKVKVTITSLM